MIYADNAATTKIGEDVLQAMMPYLLENYGNASEPYSFGRKSRKAVEQARHDIAECIHAKPEEIYFTSCGSESDNWVIKGIARYKHNQASIITSAIEHHAILRACEAVKEQGNYIRYLPVNAKGFIKESMLEKTLQHPADLVSIMLVNNEIGTIEPVKELSAIAHKHGALFHTDAVQAMGHIPINVQELDVDFLSASGHKFNAPKGIGFLYIKNGIQLSNLIDGGMQEVGRRAGTENVAFIVGMAYALKKNLSHIRQNMKHLKKLEDCLIYELKNSGIEFIRNGYENHQIPGNISLSFKNAEGEMLLHRLDLMGICVSTGSACDSNNTQLSHVLKAIQIPNEYGIGTIRISFGVYNTEDDAKVIARAIIKILRQI